MGNKRDPREVTITEAPTLITDLQTRSAIVFKNNTGSTIGLHRRGTDDNGDPVVFANCFPLEDGDIYADDKSSDQLWGMLAAAGSVDVMVWETEI